MGVIVRKIEWEGKDSRNGGIQSSTAQHNTIQNTVQCNTIQYNTIQNTVQYNAIQYNAIQYKIQCNTIQYNTIQYNTNGAIQFNSTQYNTNILNYQTSLDQPLWPPVPLRKLGSFPILWFLKCIWGTFFFIR